MLALDHLAPPFPAHGPDFFTQYPSPLSVGSAEGGLVEPGDKGYIDILAYLVVLAEDGDCPQQAPFPRPNLTGMDLKPAGQLGNRLLIHRFQGNPGLERCPPPADDSSVLVILPAPPLHLL